jgi:hypothetical protein
MSTADPPGQHPPGGQACHWGEVPNPDQAARMNPVTVRLDHWWLDDPDVDLAPMREGARAARTWRPATDCPYPAASLQREQWMWGWDVCGGADPPLTARAPRRMPTMKAILRHHGLWEIPTCVRCGLVDTAIERAHIIDRSDDGLDNCANIAPLCKWCHAGQPIFHPTETAEALAWFGLPLPAGLTPFVGPVELPPAEPFLVTLAAGRSHVPSHDLPSERS